MIKPSTCYVVINGNGDVVFRGNKHNAWRECKRRRKEGDVTAYVILAMSK